MKLVRAALSLAQAQLAGRLGERQLRRLQEAKLRRIVAHASATVPFYQSFWKSHGVDPAGVRRLEDLRHLPVVTKAQLQAADEEARLSRAYERQALIVKRTSGSTGRPMTLFRDARFEERQKLRFLHTLLAGGLRPWHRLLLVAGGLDESRSGLPGWRYISSEAPPELVLATLEAHRPHLLYGFLTPIRQMAELAREHGRPRPLKALFTTAETLDPATRVLLEDTFQTEIFDIYGCTETGPLAWECRAHQGYHVAADGAVVECLANDRDEAGRLVVTSLDLRAMPLIRYEIGDLAVEAPAGPCPCGSRLPRLARIEGRMVDCVRLADGRLLSPYHLTLALEEVAGIARYQIVQQGIGVFLVRAQGPGQGEAGVAAAAISALQRHLGAEARIQLRWEDDLEPPPGGKFRPVECRLSTEAMV
jgi:phenylacetate-CoA ligase